MPGPPSYPAGDQRQFPLWIRHAQSLRHSGGLPRLPADQRNKAGMTPSLALRIPNTHSCAAIHVDGRARHHRIFQPAQQQSKIAFANVILSFRLDNISKG